MAFKGGWGLFFGSSIHVPNNSKREKSNEKENQTNEYSLIILETLGVSFCKIPKKVGVICHLTHTNSILQNFRASFGKFTGFNNRNCETHQTHVSLKTVFQKLSHIFHCT